MHGIQPVYKAIFEIENKKKLFVVTFFGTFCFTVFKFSKTFGDTFTANASIFEKLQIEFLVEKFKQVICAEMEFH